MSLWICYCVRRINLLSFHKVMKQKLDTHAPERTFKQWSFADSRISEPWTSLAILEARQRNIIFSNNHISAQQSLISFRSHIACLLSSAAFSRNHFVIYSSDPDYLNVKLCQYVRTTHSCTTMTLNKPSSKAKTLGDRACSVVAPELWNDLPVTLNEELTLGFLN